MSRAAVSKSRAEKTKGGQNAPTPAIAHEIVPGKYTDHDWNFMLDRDDGDDFIGDMVEEVCDSAMKIIYDSYIQKQLLPFTITQAKEAILQIIEWQFLSRDEGEQNIDEDYTWAEDEEPLPAITDCWAQGLVPKQIVKVKTPEAPEIIPEEEEEDEEPEPVPPPGSLVTEEALEEVVQCVDDQQAEVTEVVTEPEPEPEHVHSPAPPPAETKPKKKPFRPYNGRLKSPGLKNITEPLQVSESRILSDESRSKQSVILEEDEESALSLLPTSCHSILKAQAGRPPGNKDVIYDEHGNVLAVVKFDPAKLPSHFVKTQFTVVDPAVEAAQARLEAMRTGSTAFSKNTMAKMAKSSTSSLRSSFEKQHDNKKKTVEVTPLPPPLLETIDVAPGVTVKEGNRTKKGPRPRPKKSDEMIQAHQESLHPVRSHANVPKFTAAEIFENQSPILRFIQDSPPIPPIPSNRQIST
ncbi:uncharacterized protein LOC141903807 isoform X2 [Tubulanus polymorphus]|uniref:uncharacterized protein LOC141903807 isoform X2 n=1 Tax=Tubulanus polymorphus TaxID=672921 RepID=UPI003DA2CBBC